MYSHQYVLYRGVLGQVYVRVVASVMSFFCAKQLARQQTRSYLSFCACGSQGREALHITEGQEGSLDSSLVP